MIISATLVFGGRPLLVPALLLAAAGLGLLIWSYRGVRLSPGAQAAAFGCKLTGLLLLVLCLLEPQWSRPVARDGFNQVVVLADDSRSLTLMDPDTARPRSDAVRDALTPSPGDWMERLGETFRVRKYQFGAALRRVDDFAGLEFDGTGTALRTALGRLGERFRGLPLAGIVLFTDGNATDWEGWESVAEQLPPIFPVVVGGEGDTPDVWVGNVRVTQTVFEDSPVEVRAEVGVRGMARVRVRAVLEPFLDPTVPDAPDAVEAADTGASGGGDEVDEGAEPEVFEREFELEDGATETVDFRFRPRSGVSFYRLEVEPVGLDGDAEATLENNREIVVVDRPGDDLRILYVSGRPNWEFKFLRRSLEADDQLRLDALIRIAKREPKFVFKGRQGESSNPLFRGFDRVDEETERYDQPVMIAVSSRPADAVTEFPAEPADLFRYDGIILDDLEAGYFSAEAQELLRRFVSERGGGLLMLGGAESFREGDYRDTAIGRLLPVYLDRPAEEWTAPTRYTLSLSREGWLESWVRLRRVQSEEEERLDALPPAAVLNRVAGVKPGASLLATVRDEDGVAFPALVTQRYGRGRSGALLVGDLWRTGFGDADRMRDLGKAWRQMARWLVVDSPRRIDLAAEPDPEEGGGRMRLRARVLDEEFQPDDTAAVTLAIRRVDPDGIDGEAPLKIPAEAVLEEPGVYEATFTPRDPGAYHAEVTAKDGRGTDIGRAETGWSANPLAAEFRSLRPDVGAMSALAERSGGRVLKVSDLDDLGERLEAAGAVVMETRITPIWHQSWYFVAALGFLSVEWIIRRRRGLA